MGRKGLGAGRASWGLVAIQGSSPIWDQRGWPFLFIEISTTRASGNEQGMTRESHGNPNGNDEAFQSYLWSMVRISVFMDNTGGHPPTSSTRNC